MTYTYFFYYSNVYKNIKASEAKKLRTCYKHFKALGFLTTKKLKIFRGVLKV